MTAALRVARNGVITLEGVFTDALDAPVDPSSARIRIRKPGGQVFLTDVPVHDGVGLFHYDLSIPVDATLGMWNAEWTGVIDGQPSFSDEAFEVTEVGMASSGDDRIDELMQQTIALMEREPSEIVLMRPPQAVSDGEGGVVTPSSALVSLTPQTVFVSGVTRDSDYRQSSYIINEQGEKFINRFVIIGMPDLDIEQGDSFVWNGDTIKIDLVHADRRWQAKAEGERVTNADG